MRRAKFPKHPLTQSKFLKQSHPMTQAKFLKHPVTQAKQSHPRAKVATMEKARRKLNQQPLVHGRTREATREMRYFVSNEASLFDVSCLALHCCGRNDSSPLMRLQSLFLLKLALPCCDRNDSSPTFLHMLQVTFFTGSAGASTRNEASMQPHEMSRRYCPDSQPTYEPGTARETMARRIVQLTLVFPGSSSIVRCHIT